jgi:molybdopterin converting factor small subunit
VGTDGEGAVTVLFFAGARRAAGTGKASLELLPGTTVSQLVEMLAERFGEDLAAVMAGSALWVNGGPAELGAFLRDGDEVAVLPPVSGGAGGSGVYERCAPGRWGRQLAGSRCATL